MRGLVMNWKSTQNENEKESIVAMFFFFCWIYDISVHCWCIDFCHNVNGQISFDQFGLRLNISFLDTLAKTFTTVCEKVIHPSHLNWRVIYFSLSCYFFQYLDFPMIKLLSLYGIRFIFTYFLRLFINEVCLDV